MDDHKTEFVIDIDDKLYTSLETPKIPASSSDSKQASSSDSKQASPPISKQIYDAYKSNLVNRIYTELIEKTYYDDVQYHLNSKSRWKTIGDICETLSHVCTGVSAVLSFSAGVFDNKILAFIAGCLGTSSLVLLKFSSYATRESKERTDQVNILLSDLGISKISDLAIDSTNCE